MRVTGHVIDYRLEMEAPFLCKERIILQISEAVAEDNLDMPHYQINIEKHKLDKKYPHKCYKCKKDLHFTELCAANMGYDEKQLKEWWKLEGIEFFCCTCYNIKKEEGTW